MIFKSKTSAAKAKEILELYRRLPRPLGSQCGVIRCGLGQNRGKFEIGEIVGSRFDHDRGYFVYAVEFDDGKTEAVPEPELFSSYVKKGGKK